MIREDERVFAGSAGAVVPERAAALVRAVLEFLFVGVIPDLHLRTAAQINPRVGERHRLVFQQQFEVAVILFRRGVSTEAVVHQFLVLDIPVGFPGFVVLGHHGLVPLLDLLGALVIRQREQLAMIVGVAAAPAREVGAVEEGDEARVLVLGRGATADHDRQKSDGKNPRKRGK